jgi:hypothetical protein
VLNATDKCKKRVSNGQYKEMLFELHIDTLDSFNHQSHSKDTE